MSNINNLTILILICHFLGDFHLQSEKISNARFKQIEEDKTFAEYYLIGTLYSILLAIILYYMIFVLI
ncbi:MAG TPA: DUF3307 domain-containing protein [Clostridiaceae bacterium]|nr:DUF3307 domain-containing protein [Clostridiaceae bacterium]